MQAKGEQLCDDILASAVIIITAKSLVIDKPHALNRFYSSISADLKHKDITPFAN